MCIPAEQPSSHNSCHHTEDSFLREIVRLLVELDRHGGREIPAIQRTWMEQRQIPAAFPQSFYITIKRLNH